MSRREERVQERLSEIRGGTTDRLRWGPLVACALLAIAGMACGSSSGGAPDTTTQELPARLLSAQIRPATEGALVELLADKPPTWTASSGSETSFSIHLLNTVPGPELTNLAAAEGEIESLVFDTELRDGRPATIMKVTARSRAAHSVKSEGDRLIIRVNTDPTRAFAGSTSPPGTGAPAAGAGISPRRTVYRISPGDLLTVDVFGHDEFDRKARVQDDGKIALPLLGRFPIAGFTVEGAEQEIEKKLRKAQLLSSPEVFVAIEEYSSYGVTVQGAVARPGIYPVIGRKGLLEVIWAAGGLLEGSQPGQKIVVLRPDGQGQQRRIEIDAEKLLDEGDMSLNIPVLPGDNVVVPKAKLLRVYVSGAVQRPGPVEFRSSQGLTVLQAITLAGGPNERANLGKVIVIRQNPEGAQETIKVNVKKIQRGKANDVFLQNNDTVRVAVWFF